MLDITYLWKPLEKTILEQQISFQVLNDIQGILLLKDQEHFSSHYLYVGRYSDGIRLLTRLEKESEQQESCTFFLAAEDVNRTRLPSLPRHNILVSALDMTELYNRISLTVEHYRRWAFTLRDIFCSGQDLTQLIAQAAAMIRSQIYVLNPGYKVIAGSPRLYFEDPCSRELQENGCLSFPSAQRLQAAISKARPEGSYRRLLLDERICHFCEIICQDYGPAFILMPEPSGGSELDLRHLLLDLAETVKHFLMKNQTKLLNQSALCASFIQDICEERLTGDAEIRDRAQALPHPMKAFCCLILIRFDEDLNPRLPDQFLLQQLEDIFPETNMAVYKGDIVLLHTQEERPGGSGSPMSFDYGRLEDLLARHHACAAISNASRQRDRLRTLYQIAAATLRLGKLFHRPHLSERIFSHEDYSIYYIVDLCASQFIRDHHHDDLVYLIHPSIIKICRYDAVHKTNLRDVLYYYLLCGCSLNRTAKAMYMHRNTIMNKLNKINEIAEIPLEDGYMRHRMIMSCLIMQYYEIAMKMTIRL